MQFITNTIFGPLQELGNIILSYQEAQTSLQNFDILMMKPVEERPEEPIQIRNAQQTPLTGHVLVAEDNRINQMFIIELLKYCGFTCDVAANGNEALEALQNRPYDLVLMDCNMPEMDGFAASREIRRREAVQELSGRLPIIALTANALKGDRERCLDAGMDDYLSKPIDAVLLQATLAKFVNAVSNEPLLSACEPVR